MRAARKGCGTAAEGSHKAQLIAPPHPTSPSSQMHTSRMGGFPALPHATVQTFVRPSHAPHLDQRMQSCSPQLAFDSPCITLGQLTAWALSRQPRHHPPDQQGAAHSPCSRHGESWPLTLQPLTPAHYGCSSSRYRARYSSRRAAGHSLSRGPLGLPHQKLGRTFPGRTFRKLSVGSNRPTRL